MSAVLAEIENLSVAYRTENGRTAALSQVDLAIEAGKRLAVIGESGSGKSTLALAITDLLPNDALVEGEIAWPGLPHLPAPGRDIGFVFQDPGASLDPVLSIGEQIAEVAKNHLGFGWREAYIHACDLLERVRIPQPEAALRAYPHQLSGGQRQRVAIAVAIAAQPKLLIADEPTSALDTIVQREIVSLLDRLVSESGMALLFITHDIALASGFADAVAVFHESRLVEAGAADEVLSRPSRAYTRLLIDSHIDLATPPLIEGAQA
ncbi:ABC transporter ATP-binding protein [Aquamicrobium sp. LC103]|uniref:ABC transporter ATP-binding protein n=1 Tax=Aquamicrobium sp. LC103 TaxID=1120658 RepID=UPI0010C9C19B|nr:ABC transporter ATP-binding protein [Aquamicrobium sp. LC103]TKT74665.1 ABC transporter ATP-binding protein [Aquamicrobium sp. LC103]